MEQIRAVLSDADGTLITQGRLDHFPSELKDVIREARSRNVWFNLASGRPYFEQEHLLSLLLEPDRPVPGEGILYEGAGVRLFGSGQSFLLGGLSRTQITEIETYLVAHNLLRELVPQDNNERYETQTGFVTPKFVREGETDHALLRQRFGEIKPAVERQFPHAEVAMSGDTVDIIAKGMTKAISTLKYAELTGIPLDQIAAIGDSGNDLPMLEVVGNAGGLAVYVGRDAEQENVVRQYPNHFVPVVKGPMGTIEALKLMMTLNQVEMFHRC